MFLLECALAIALESCVENSITALRAKSISTGDRTKLM